MKTAEDPAVDYRALVRDGYDRCAAAYAEARSRDPVPELALLLDRLPARSRVLDLGCGAGVPVARELARHHRVTGVDFSPEQIRRARANVPDAEFRLADLMATELPDASFDAVVAIYVLFHLPREEHAELLRRVSRWLARGGLLLVTVSRAREAAYTEEDFFGVRMYWSHFGRHDYVRMLESLGFELLDARTIGHGYGDAPERRPESHPLLCARRR